MIHFKDWYGEEEKKEVNRYRHLFHFLQTNLSDIQVFRVGQTEIDAYIVGEVKFGGFAGIVTKIIAT